MVGHGIGADGAYRHAAGLDEIHHRGGKVLPEILDPAVVLLLEGVAQDPLEAGVGLAGHGPVIELVRVGLIAEEPHSLAVLRQVEGHLQGKGGLAGGGVSADDHHVPGAGVELLVQIRETQLQEVGRLAAVPALEEGPESLLEGHPPDPGPLAEKEVGLVDGRSAGLLVLGHG